MSQIFDFAGSLAEGKAAREAGDFNAAALRDQARTARMQGVADEEAQRRQARQVLGEQAAAIAQSGASGGTSDLIAHQSAVNAELDALNIRYGAQMRSRGLLSQAMGAEMQGKAAQKASYFKAGASLLRGSGQMVGA